MYAMLDIYISFFYHIISNVLVRYLMFPVYTYSTESRKHKEETVQSNFLQWHLHNDKKSSFETRLCFASRFTCASSTAPDTLPSTRPWSTPRSWRSRTATPQATRTLTTTNETFTISNCFCQPCDDPPGLCQRSPETCGLHAHCSSILDG